MSEPKLKQCDCCGKMAWTVSRCWAFGIETFACATCRGGSEADEIEQYDIGDDSLRFHTETGQ